MMTTEHGLGFKEYMYGDRFIMHCAPAPVPLVPIMLKVGVEAVTFKELEHVVVPETARFPLMVPPVVGSPPEPPVM